MGRDRRVAAAAVRRARGDQHDHAELRGAPRGGLSGSRPAPGAHRGVPAVGDARSPARGSRCSSPTRGSTSDSPWPSPRRSPCGGRSARRPRVPGCGRPG
jgi:hypothetical protein